ncbi:MAG: 16S rRNA processing protein RimM [Chloroflexi bacterium]|nr:16S rRNA processing protein RimM [Chloroflexota bacterium]
MMAESNQSTIAIGRIVGIHGVRGEVKVDVYTDFPERFEPGSDIVLEGEAQLYRILSTRPHKGMLLIHLEGFTSRAHVERLRGKHLVIPRDLAKVLDEDEYYVDELQGLRVSTDEGIDLGMLDEVLWTGANEVYVVHGEYGEVLLPAISEVIREVDLQDGYMIVRLLPGLVQALDK